MIARPRLLVVSHVPPLPRDSGQRQRVRHMLLAARRLFRITFACSAPAREAGATLERLAPLCDEVVVLPSICRRSTASRILHRVRGSVDALRRGLRLSNYVIGKVEFAPERILPLARERRFDLALFEYWHASAAAAALAERGIPCLLDMHDILWRALDAAPGSRLLRARQVRLYRRAEEAAWGRFSGVIAINRAERDYVAARVPAGTRVFLGPMGVDPAEWPCAPAPRRRLAFYGGLSSPENRAAAERFVRGVLPRVRRVAPDVEAYVIGRGAPAGGRGLFGDPEVRTTGFVEPVAPLLGTMAAVVCPWRGAYGFRSRLVEAMAAGVPVVVTPDAIEGMELEEGEGVLVGAEEGALADRALSLLLDPALAARQGAAARAQVEGRLSFEATYGRLFGEVAAWLAESRSVRA
jgi:glycosyltransferase involved in cell wall biosynthesis